MNSSIDYSQQPPQPVPGKMKIMEYSPMGNFISAGSGETVRFDLSGDDGMLDPYSTYFEVSVDFSLNPNLLNDTAPTNGAVTYTNKIIQLDSSAHSLFSQLLLLNGSDELERIQELDTLMAFLTDMGYDVDKRFARDYEGLGGVYANSIPGYMSTPIQTPKTNSGNTVQYKYWTPQEDYNLFVDTNSSATAFGNSTSPPNVNAGPHGYYTLNHATISNQLAFNPYYNVADTTYSSMADVREWYNDFNNLVPGNSPGLNGTFQYIHPAFCQGTFEPWFSRTVYQRYMKNGFVKCDTITTATFFLPVISGIIGQLMPMEKHKFIPTWLLRLFLEMTFSPHAFYTSWYTKDQSARRYIVTTFKLHATLIEPTDEVKAMINEEFQRGIYLATETFSQGTKLSITGGAVPPTVQIPQGYRWLKNIFTVFMPNDYYIAANCRKHYRLSMAINKMQLRIGNDYYPQIAIKGNAGTNMGKDNNYEFVRMLYKGFNRMCNPSGSINPHNFAINCRALDPNQPLLYGMNDNDQGCLFSENMMVGKAVFCIPLMKNYLGSTIYSGVSTAGRANVQLEFQYDASRTFPRPVTMLNYLHHEVVLKILPEGISVEV